MSGMDVFEWRSRSIGCDFFKPERCGLLVKRAAADAGSFPFRCSCLLIRGLSSLLWCWQGNLACTCTTWMAQSVRRWSWASRSPLEALSLRRHRRAGTSRMLMLMKGEGRWARMLWWHHLMWPLTDLRVWEENLRSLLTSIITHQMDCLVSAEGSWHELTPLWAQGFQHGCGMSLERLPAWFCAYNCQRVMAATCDD